MLKCARLGLNKKKVLCTTNICTNKTPPLFLPSKTRIRYAYLEKLHLFFVFVFPHFIETYSFDTKSMSHSWRLSRGVAGQETSSNSNERLGSAAVETPLTPPSVRNVSPSICLDMVQFRALMQEYRALDDSVTTRLNRTLANTRASGLNSSPSILSGHVPSNSSLDLGKSTYAIAPEQACLQFWRELVNVWIGREEVLQYCLQVEERSRIQHLSPTGTSSARLGREEWLLDNDVERERRQNGLSASDQIKQRKSKYDAFDSRASRTEDSAETLVS